MPMNVLVASTFFLFVLAFPFSQPAQVDRMTSSDQGVCDTITIPGVTDLKFIPLTWFMSGLDLSPDERRWIGLGLHRQKLEMDSLWIQPDHDALTSDQLELPICHISGLRKQINLIKKGQLITGNWSGKDGTLTIDRKTGASHFLSWF